MLNRLFWLCTLFISGFAQADYILDNCTYTINEATVNLPSVKISLDPNAPVGTLFYAYTYTMPGGSGTFTCAGNATQVYQQNYLNQSGGTTILLSGVASFPANSPVYKTTIPGIGVMISKGSTRVLPIINTPATLSGGSMPLKFKYTSLSIDINLVKYADIPTGVSHIDLSDIPGVDVSTQFVEGTSKFTTASVPVPINKPFVLGRFFFGPGGVELLTATCDTPDVLVDLGRRNITDSTNREGALFATPWVDASINLTNCPVFYGVGGRNNATSGNVKNNVMTLTLIPNNTTTSSQGIMPVDSGGNAATGVGIQLAYGTASSNTKVNFASGEGTKTYTLNSSIGSTYTLPLVARYIQTASTIGDIQPGNANGKITYLVDYF